MCVDSNLNELAKLLYLSKYHYYNDMRIRKKKSKNNGLARFLRLIVITASISLITVIVSYFVFFNSGWSSDQSVWGAFGDYFGGVLNPLLSFL